MDEIAAYKLRLAEAIKSEWQKTLREVGEATDQETYTSRDILICNSNVHLEILRLLGYGVSAKTDLLSKIQPHDGFAHLEVK